MFFRISFQLGPPFRKLGGLRYRGPWGDRASQVSIAMIWWTLLRLAGRRPGGGKRLRFFSLFGPGEKTHLKKNTHTHIKT